MSGFLGSKTAIALAVQADSTSRATVATPGDLTPIANIRDNDEVFTFTNPEYTGTIHKPGDAVLGRGAGIGFDIMNRGPGGSAPPSAGDYVPGRIMRAAGWDEIVFASALSEALGGAGSNAGETTVVQLGAGASSVDGFYVGFVIQFASLSGGSGFRSCAQIVAYDGGTKNATLATSLAALPTGNYTIPPQLLYRLNATANQLWLTFDKWLDQKRYKQQNGSVGALQFAFPTSNRGNSSAPTMTVGLVGDYDESDDETDENAPAVPSGGAIPPVRAGILSLAGVQVAGPSVSFDMGLQVDFPPDQNANSGNAPACIVETRRSCSLNLNENLLTKQDRSALANSQGHHALQLAYGQTAGRSVWFCVPKGRLSFPRRDASGNFVTDNVDFLIDDADKSVAIAYPYFT